METRAQKKVIHSLYILFFLVCTQSTSVFAIEQQVVTVDPAFQEVTLKEKDTAVPFFLTYANTTDSPQYVEFFPIDIKQIGENGEVAFIDKPQVGDKVSAANFIKLSTSSAILQPGMNQKIDFRVENFQSLGPGGHYGAIIARFSPLGSEGKQMVVPGVSSFVLVRKVGGERYSLSLVQESLLPTTFLSTVPKEIRLMFENNGNIHVVPRGTIEITDLFGRMISRGIINDGSLFLFPGARRQFSTPMYSVKKALPLMLYTLKVSGESEPGDIPYFTQTSFVVIKPLTAIITLLSIGGIVAALWKLKRKRGKKSV